MSNINSPIRSRRSPRKSVQATNSNRASIDTTAVPENMEVERRGNEEGIIGKRNACQKKRLLSENLLC